MKENHDELGYFMAQKITEKMLEKGLISFDEYDKLTALNRRLSHPFTPTYCRKDLIYRQI